jgi:tetratricopeptide (TPR) repeat protein
MVNLGIFFFNIGDYPRQIEIHRKVRKLLTGEEAFKQHGLASLPGALSRSMLVLGMAELGEFNKIDEIGHEALEIAEQVRNALTLAFVYNFLPMSYLRLGEFKPAISLLEKCRKVCHFSEVQSMYSVTVVSLGYAYLLATEPNRALAVMEEGTKEDNLRASFWPAHPFLMLADVYRAVGKGSEAAETISHALKISSEREEKGFEAWAMFVMAGINNAANRSEEAKNGMSVL